MVQNSIVFNPASLRDLQDVIEYLMKFSDSKRIIINLFHQEYASGLTFSEEDIKKLRNQVEDQIQKNRLTQDKCDELQKSLNQKEKDFESMIDSYNKQLNEKDNEIKKLRHKLETFSISYGAEDLSTIAYFEVNNGHLEETMINKEALYCAKRENGCYRFGINYDGPIRTACENPDKFIKPFCKIIGFVEGATSISQRNFGEAELMGTELVVNRKVEIDMIKE